MIFQYISLVTRATTVQLEENFSSIYLIFCLAQSSFKTEALPSRVSVPNSELECICIYLLFGFVPRTTNRNHHLKWNEGEHNPHQTGQ